MYFSLTRLSIGTHNAAPGVPPRDYRLAKYPIDVDEVVKRIVEKVRR